MATLGKAYVQIVPSADGISGSITNLLGGETAKAGKEAGNSFASNLLKVAKGAIAAAGIGKLLSASLNAGGALQQSFGGIETLYGDAADAAKKYAQEAASAGISANTYAEQAVSFGASLKQAFGGDTAAAAEAANNAIMAMADNSAKFGTDITSVQAAYQGFAKQNYTMLDNLKLGYGGTRSEMERLLTDAEALTGVHYDIDNLGDVYSAIGAIQENLGVAGVAAQEAQTTFTGSFGAMQASAENFLASLSLGTGVQESMAALLESTSTFVFGNLLPMIGNILTALPQALVTAITTGVPLVVQSLSDLASQAVSAVSSVDWIGLGEEVLTTLNDGILAKIPDILTSMADMVTDLSGYLQESMPEFLERGGEFLSNMITGILGKLPDILGGLMSVVTALIGLLMDNLPQFLAKGWEITLGIMKGIWDKLPDIVGKVFQLLGELITTIVNKLPDFIQQGVELVGSIIDGIGDAIPDILETMTDMAKQAIDAVKEIDWLDLGVQIINGIVDGIKSIGDLIGSTLQNLAKGAWEGLKDFFGVASPSKLMRDTVGKMLPLGIAEGINAEAGAVTDAMEEMASETALGAQADFSVSGSWSAAPQASEAAAWGGVTINIDAKDRSTAEVVNDVKQALMVEMRQYAEAY